MSDNPLSLAGLASQKTGVSREAPDSRTKSASAKATSRAGFGGLLKTFLGKEKSGAAGRKTSGSGRSTGPQGAGGSMKPGEKKALRKSLDKTVSNPDAEQAEQDEGSAEAAAAAREAAELIWNLLYGPGLVPAALPGASLRDFAGLVGLPGGSGNAAFGSLGGASVTMAVLQEGMATANASAEMNNAAVLASLDELLDGLPRGALESALADTARSLGVENATDMLDRIAAMLDADISAVNSGLGKELLAQLDIAAGNNPSLAAENSGLPVSSEAILTLFEEFLQQKSQENGDGGPENMNGKFSGDGAEPTFQAFADWLVKTGNTAGLNGLSASAAGLAEALLHAAGTATLSGTGEAGAYGKVFSWMKSNVESALQFIEAMNNAAEQAPAGQFAPLASGSAAGGAAQAASVPGNGMLAQLENIERLSEAMRMANRGGVKNLTMQLSPPELGKVMLRVESRDGVVSAYLRVEKPEAAAQLASNLNQLRESLKAQGIELGELDIRERGQNEALGDFSGGKGRRDPEADYGRQYGSGRGDAGALGEAPEVETSSTRATDGPLNLIA